MKVLHNTNTFVIFAGFAILQILLTGLIDLGPLFFICVYPLFLLTLPLDFSTNRLMLWAFAMGLVIDYFSNSILGINSAASLVMVLVQPRLFKLIYRKGDMENQLRPGLRELGIRRFFAYIALNLLIHHIALTTLESFGFAHFLQTLPRVLISLIVNTLLILVIEYGVFYKDYR
jgi:rod shape-determining protein MreD